MELQLSKDNKVIITYVGHKIIYVMSRSKNQGMKREKNVSVNMVKLTMFVNFQIKITQ